jgi:hypothetical protein
MIHGKSVSIGCLAVGDAAVEDLFVLAAESGIERIELVLSPVDFRNRDLPSHAGNGPAWVPELYAEIRRVLRALFPETVG